VRVLHVAALPFPSPQGTQALLGAMMRAECAAGIESHLLCYADGLGVVDADVTVHRVGPRIQARSLGAHAFRSGPSLRKLVLDAALVARVRRVAWWLNPDILIAHHVEAAAACALAAVPFAYCAHTSVEAELPSYFPGWPRLIFARVGHVLDGFSLRAARTSMAVSPLLADMLASAHGQPAQCVPLPWPMPHAVLPGEQAEARRTLGLPEEAHVALYAGNLDAYQGLAPALMGLALAASTCPSLRVVIATASGRDQVRRLLGPYAVLHERMLHVPLAGEAVRRMLHAAASVVLVPRSAPGGLPIKLLDALSRGRAVVAAQTASAGYDLSQVCRLVPDASPPAWAEAVCASPVGEPERMRAWIGCNFSDQRYVAALRARTHPVRSCG
jgi:glycosyltransferase involved in cell wall biosynthesis